MKKLLISAGALAARPSARPLSPPRTTATANATVNIVSPLTLTNNTGLDFGTVVGPFASQTVRVDTAGNRNCGGLTCSGTTFGRDFHGQRRHRQPEFGADGRSERQPDLGRQQPDRRSDDRLPTGLRRPTPAAARPSASAVRSTIPAGTSDGVYSGTFNVHVDYQ